MGTMAVRYAVWSMFAGSFRKSAGSGSCTPASFSFTRRMLRPPLNTMCPVVRSAGYGNTPLRMVAL